jgi:hypothetical protein
MTESLESEIRSLKPGARTILISGFRFLTSVFLLSVFWLLISAPAAQAVCSSPAGNAGDTIYNNDYHVPTYCDGTHWKPMGPQGAGGVGCAPSSTGLVGWWKLDDGAGTSATDSSGNAITLTTQNSPTWTTGGKINGALKFDGSTQYADIADPPALRIGGSFTLSAWVNFAALPTSGLYANLIDKEATGGTNYQLTVDNNFTTAGLGWILNYNSTGCCDNRVVKYTTPINTATWYHVVAVYDSVAQTESLYVNGAFGASASVAGFPPESNGGPFNIGVQHNGGFWGGYLNATLDDVRVYNRALSASEVSTLAAAGVEGDMMYNNDYHLYQFCDGTNWIAMGPTGAGGNLSNGLVGWWKLDQSSSPSLDSSGNGYSGTWNNSPTYTASGKINGALTFSNASENYLNMGNTTAMNGLAAITVSAWIKASSSGANLPETHVVDKSICDGSITSGPFELGLNLESISSERAEFAVYPVGVGAIVSGYGTSNVDDGNWHFLLGEYDGSTASIWVDGVEQNSSAVSGTLTSTSTFMDIGGACGSASPGMIFNGTIDDVRVYNRALSAAEILELYGCTGPAGQEGDLIYNSSNSVMQFCNGANWVRLGQ